MSLKKSLTLALWLAAAALPLAATTNVQEIDLTGTQVSPRFPNLILGYPIPQRWQHCSTLRFRVNNTIDPIPNPLGAPFLHVADTIPVFQQAADLWNSIPTSYKKIQVVGTVANSGRTTFDLVNELSFRTGPLGTLGFPNVAFRGVFERNLGPIAAARRTILLADFTFKDGMDLNGDGKPDFLDSVSDCTEVDGHTVYPTGLYKAGAPLDMDIMFAVGQNIGGVTTPGFRFTIDPAQIDSNPQSVDLFAVAVQAFGLAQSVGHSMTSQISNSDGTGSVMYPYIDASDPKSELANRRLDSDAVLTLSRIYPRGSADDPKPLGPGEVPFLSTVGFITGKVTMGSTNQPLAGANVIAIDHATGRVVSSAVSGHAVWDTQRDGFNSVVTSVPINVLDGQYSLIVPPGVYDVRAEPSDDQPAGHQHINLMTLMAWQLGVEVGQKSYNEAWYNSTDNGALKRSLGTSTPVTVAAGQTVSGIDMTTPKTVDIINYGSLDSLGSRTAPPGTYYAVRIPADQVSKAFQTAGGKPLILGAMFMTGVKADTDIPVFAEAQFTTGRIKSNGTAQIDIASPIEKVQNLIARDFDYTPIYFKDPSNVAAKVGSGINKGKVTDLFLVLRAPKSGTQPLIGRDGSNPVHDAPIYGYSYMSTDGGKTFTQVKHFNFMFKLIVGQDPGSKSLGPDSSGE
jgi:hypothetical protein